MKSVYFFLIALGAAMRSGRNFSRSIHRHQKMGTIVFNFLLLLVCIGALVTLTISSNIVSTVMAMIQD